MRLETENLDLVDAYLLSWIESKGAPGVYSLDSDLRGNAVELLPVKWAALSEEDSTPSPVRFEPDLGSRAAVETPRVAAQCMVG